MAGYICCVRPLFFIAALLFTACTAIEPPFECADPIGCVTILPNDPIKLGIIQDLSGGGAVFGLDQIRSLELAIAERNGQILNHPLALQIEDEGCTAEGGANAALRIIADPQVVGLFGTTCSSAAAAAARIMSEAGLSMVSGVNSSTSLTSVDGQPGADWQPGYFRTMLNVALEGKAAAAFAFEELGITKAAVIGDGDTFSETYKDTFARAFTELGGEIVLDVTINKGDTDMRPVLLSVVVSGGEFMFLSLFPPEGAAIVQQARQIDDLQTVTIFAGGALRTDDFIQAVKADGKGIYSIGSAPPPKGTANDELVAAYKETYAEAPPTVTYAYGYDAANLLLQTIEQVAVQENDGTLHIGRGALRDALYGATNFAGVTGRLTCDAYGDCAFIKFDLVRLDEPEAGLAGLLSNVIYTYLPDRPE